MKLTNFRKISKQKALDLGIPEYIWLVKYDHKTWHYNLKAKSFIGLVCVIIKIYIYDIRAN
jgi:hypothetical protein